MGFASRIILSVLAVMVVTSTCNAKKIPDYLTVCRRSNPKYDDCIKKSIMASRTYIGKGISRLHVPPAEPLVIPQLIVDRDLDNLRIHAKLNNIKIYGIPGFQVEHVKSDLSKLEMSVTVLEPKLYVEMDFDVDGRLLLVPIRGIGKFKGNFTNSRGTVKGNADVVTNKKGMKHLKLRDVKINLDAGEKPNFQIENRDERNAAVLNTAANFVRQNIRQVIQIVTPIAEETMSEVGRQFGDDILSTMPFAEILPD